MTAGIDLVQRISKYEPSKFERTFNHKLDQVTIKELEQLKNLNKDRIKEIEEKYFEETKTQEKENEQFNDDDLEKLIPRSLKKQT